MLMSQLDTQALGLLLKELFKLPQKARGVKNISPEGLARDGKKMDWDLISLGKSEPMDSRNVLRQLRYDSFDSRLIGQSARSDLTPMHAETELNECRQPYLRWPW
jgi:hypothetical protein